MMSRISVLLLLLPFAPAAGQQHSSDTQTYIVHMDVTRARALDLSLGGTKRWPEAVLESLLQLSSSEQEREVAAPPQLLYVYDTTLSGFAAKLSPKQAKSLQQLDGLLSAYPDEMLIQLHTTYSPQFLGLMPGRGLWASPNLASDIIIGTTGHIRPQEHCWGNWKKADVHSFKS